MMTITIIIIVPNNPPLNTLNTPITIDITFYYSSLFLYFLMFLFPSTKITYSILYYHFCYCTIVAVSVVLWYYAFFVLSLVVNENFE